MKQILDRKRAVNAQTELPKEPHTDYTTLNEKNDKKEINKIKHDLMNRRVTYLVMILALWTFQIGFGLFIVLDSWAEIQFSKLPSLKIGLTRFICGVVMHIQCDKEFRNGLNIMKFSVNHYWKFDNYKLAFLPGFL